MDQGNRGVPNGWPQQGVPGGQPWPPHQGTPGAPPWPPQQGFQQQPTPSWTPAPPSGAPTPPAPRQPRGSGVGLKVLVGVLSGLLVLTVGAVVLLLLDPFKGVEFDTTQPAPAPSAAPAESAAGEEAPVEDASSAATEEHSETATPTPTPSPTPTEPPFVLPAGVTPCDQPNVAVNEMTTCPFASNVYDAVVAAQGREGVVHAYSPVTKQHYDMTCQRIHSTAMVCTGGNNAAVYITKG